MSSSTFLIRARKQSRLSQNMSNRFNSLTQLTKRNSVQTNSMHNRLRTHIYTGRGYPIRFNKVSSITNNFISHNASFFSLINRIQHIKPQ